MKIRVEWDDPEKTVLRYDFLEGWTWSDYLAAVEVSNPMMKSVGYTIDFIANFEHSALPPLWTFAGFQRSRDYSPPNLGVIVVVGASRFVEALINLAVFTRLYKKLGQKIVVVHTLQDARAAIAQWRQRQRELAAPRHEPGLELQQSPGLPDLGLPGPAVDSPLRPPPAPLVGASDLRPAGIRVEWDDEEKTILYYRFGPGWTWEDFWAAHDVVNAMLAEVPHQVDLIADFEGSRLPALRDLGQFRRAQEIMAEQIGVVVVTGGQPFLDALVTAFSRIYEQYAARLLTAESADEARALLAQRRSS